MMSMQELETARRLGLPFVVLVWNDGGLGLIEMHQQRRFGHVSGTRFGSPDYVALARSFGLEGMRVERAGDFATAARPGARQRPRRRHRRADRLRRERQARHRSLEARARRREVATGRDDDGRVRPHRLPGTAFDAGERRQIEAGLRGGLRAQSERAPRAGSRRRSRNGVYFGCNDGDTVVGSFAARVSTSPAATSDGGWRCCSLTTSARSTAGSGWGVTRDTLAAPVRALRRRRRDPLSVRRAAAALLGAARVRGRAGGGGRFARPSTCGASATALHGRPRGRVRRREGLRDRGDRRSRRTLRRDARADPPRRRGDHRAAGCSTGSAAGAAGRRRASRGESPAAADPAADARPMDHDGASRPRPPVRLRTVLTWPRQVGLFVPFDV